MRMRDWSSDVCASDLLGDEVEGFLLAGLRAVGLRLGLALARAALALRLLLGVAFAEQVVVVDELVAVGGQKIGGRVLHADADYGLVVLAQLADQRRAVGVAADDDEAVDVRLGIAEVEGIDDEADVEDRKSTRLNSSTLLPLRLP